jgi:hypothetical protein
VGEDSAGNAGGCADTPTVAGVGVSRGVCSAGSSGIGLVTGTTGAEVAAEAEVEAEVGGCTARASAERLSTTRGEAAGRAVRKGM